MTKEEAYNAAFLAALTGFCANPEVIVALEMGNSYFEQMASTTKNASTTHTRTNPWCNHQS
jgi:hypothetical protein